MNEDIDVDSLLQGEVTDEQLRALTVPVTPQSVEQRAMHIFKQNAERIAQEIVDLAVGAGSEKVRLDASKYVTDRLLGRIDVARPAEEAGAPWEDVYGTILREPTASERTKGARVVP